MIIISHDRQGQHNSNHVPDNDLEALKHRMDRLEQEHSNITMERVLYAEQIKEASPNDASSGPQPEVREEGGDTAEGSEGIQ